MQQQGRRGNREGLLRADGDQNIFVLLSEGILLFYLVAAAARVLMG